MSAPDTNPLRWCRACGRMHPWVMFAQTTTGFARSCRKHQRGQRAEFMRRYRVKVRASEDTVRWQHVSLLRNPPVTLTCQITGAVTPFLYGCEDGWVFDSFSPADNRRTYSPAGVATFQKASRP